MPDSIKALKIRIYPNKAQIDSITATMGCCRYVYNWALSFRNDAYRLHGVNMNYTNLANAVSLLKNFEQYKFLDDADSIALQQCLKDQENAFKRFYSGLGGYPKFKRKKDNHQSYRTGVNKNSVKIDSEFKLIKIPKLGWIKYKGNLKSVDEDRINFITVENTPSGKYYISVNFNYTYNMKPVADGKIGIDVGIKSFYTDSNGKTINNPKYLKASAKKLAREQRRLSKKQHNSKNYEKQRIKVAKIHERVCNQRDDFLHKVVNDIINENQIICIEDLKVRNMVRNHHLAYCISDASWGKFKEILAYKAELNGRTLVLVPTFYASSQLCHKCGHKNTSVKNLNIRKYICPVCGSILDRDFNAAINILMEGLRILAI